MARQWSWLRRKTNQRSWCCVNVPDRFDNRCRRFRDKQDRGDRRDPLVDFKGVCAEMTTVLPPTLQWLRSNFLPFLAI